MSDPVPNLVRRDIRTPDAPADRIPGARAAARILVVDDEPAVREVLQLFLQRRGHAVTLAADGKTGLRRFQDAPDAFDLVITDLRMPNFSGLELTSALREIRPDLSILLLSGFVDEWLEERARAAGVDAFLTKPVSQQDLFAAVDRLFLATETPN